jgi:hypothetical protein
MHGVGCLWWRGWLVGGGNSDKIWREDEVVLMSSSHNRASWIDRWFPLLLILFGLTFILTLALFAPSY